MKSYVLYCHTNKLNGKKYIGITSQVPRKRWNNGNGYKNNLYFYRAIQKYGWHNFSHEILYTDLTQQEAENLEIKIIAEYKSFEKEYGYNIELGGNSGNKFTKETRDKISNALKGKPKTESHKKNLSISKKGFVVSDETKKKLSIAFSGQNNPMYGRMRRNDPIKTKKSVICEETKIIYQSVSEAARETGIDQGDISKACNGKLKSAGGYHWRFEEVV